MTESTKALHDTITQFRLIWSQRNVEDPLVVCKFVEPLSWRIRYATEFDSDSKVFYWFVQWFFDERWSFTFDELCEIARDSALMMFPYTPPKSLSRILKK